MTPLKPQRNMHAIALRYGRNIKPKMTGFSLIELAIVLMIVSLLFVFVLPTSSVILNNRKRELTRQKLINVETAIANYVAINKRLPCPADGGGTTGIELRAPATAGFSVDCAAATPNTNQQTGVVPWVTLGLTFADVVDGWDRQITYRAGFGLTRDSALDMSACDPAGTAATTPVDVDVANWQLTANTSINVNTCNALLTCVGTGTTCSNPQKSLINKGFSIIDVGGTPIMNPLNFTGAAYVLISHGENGVGAFTNTQVAIPGVPGTLEAANYNNTNAVSAANTTVSLQFRDAPLSDSSNAATYFDDYLLHPSLFSLIQRAQIGPRSH